jgi:putative addiction module component (TIGR02574 family)
MASVTDELKDRLALLPVKERADLAQFLIHTLDEAADLEAEAAWDVELARREREIRSGQAAGEPAESVFARLRETCA